MLDDESRFVFGPSCEKAQKRLTRQRAVQNGTSAERHGFWEKGHFMHLRVSCYERKMNYKVSGQ